MASTFYTSINYSTINMQDLLRWLQLNHKVNAFVVTQSYQYRPDLIQSQIYYDPNYFPFLMVFNNIRDITTLSPGSIIYYPNLIDIQSYIYEQSERYST